MNRTRFSLLLCLISAGLLAGCSLNLSTISYKKDQQNALKETERLHDLFNSGMYEAIYEMADSHAKQTKSKDALIAVLTRLRTEKGRILSAQLVNATVEPRALYREVHLSFQTKFENTESKEDIVWCVSNEKAGFYTLMVE